MRGFHCQNIFETFSSEEIPKPLPWEFIERFNTPITAICMVLKEIIELEK